MRSRQEVRSRASSRRAVRSRASKHQAVRSRTNVKQCSAQPCQQCKQSACVIHFLCSISPSPRNLSFSHLPFHPSPLQQTSGSFPSLLHQSLHQITRAPETSLSATNRLHPTPSGNMPSYACVLSQLHPCIPLTDGKAGSPTSPHRTYLEPTAPLTPLPNRKAGSQPPLRGTLSRVLLG